MGITTKRRWYSEPLPLSPQRKRTLLDQIQQALLSEFVEGGKTRWRRTLNRAAAFSRVKDRAAYVRDGLRDLGIVVEAWRVAVTAMEQAGMTWNAKAGAWEMPASRRKGGRQ